MALGQTETKSVTAHVRGAKQGTPFHSSSLIYFVKLDIHRKYLFHHWSTASPSSTT
jgi:hypothetical protein